MSTRDLGVSVQQVARTIVSVDISSRRLITVVPALAVVVVLYSWFVR